MMTGSCKGINGFRAKKSPKIFWESLFTEGKIYSRYKNHDFFILKMVNSGNFTVLENLYLCGLI